MKGVGVSTLCGRPPSASRTAGSPSPAAVELRLEPQGRARGAFLPPAPAQPPSADRGMKPTWRIVLCLLALPWLAAPAPAVDAPAKSDDSGKGSLTETTHTITVGGAKLEYRATAGMLLLKDEDGKTTASIFFVAYTKTGVDDLPRGRSRSSSTAAPARRRCGCTSAPSAPSAWSWPTRATPLPPPYRLVDNEDTLARPDRPGVHRPGQHRLQPARRSRRTASSSTACRRTSTRSATSSACT